MQKIILAAATATALLTSLGAATSASAIDQIDRREQIQENRIRAGVRSGEITRHEYRVLEAEQSRIRELERRARADGHIDSRERAQITQAQNAASRHIYRESHDNQRAWWRRWY